MQSCQMSVEVRDLEPDVDDAYLQYRALSSLAVASLVLGAASLSTFLGWWLAVVPVTGIALGLIARRRIARLPRELTGKGIAVAGILTSVVFGSMGLGYVAYDYATEVPEGYQRISYDLLQPNPDVPGEVVPRSAFALEGKKVFVKGYIFPGRDSTGIKRFLLVRDQGDCCFGGNPKVTDRIQVTLVDPLRLTYDTGLQKLAGTFHVAPTQAADAVGGGGVFYHLTADHLD